MMTKYKIMLLALILLAGCKTKEKTQQLEKEKLNLELSETLDSLVEFRFKERLNSTSKLNYQGAKFSLQSTPVFDSLGNRVPFHFKHYVDGDLKEEIYLEGGEVATSTETTTTTETMRHEVDVGKKEKVKATKNTKVNIKAKAKKSAKKVEVTGFQAGVYITWLIIILVLILLWWLNRRFNLVGLIKAVNTNELTK